MIEHAVDCLRGCPTPELFAAVGHRADVVKAGLAGMGIKPLEYPKTLGLGFRAATCLEMLRKWEGPTVISYCDMPLISSQMVRELTRLVEGPKDKKVFGLLVTGSQSGLSGYVERDKTTGDIVRIIQSRMVLADEREYRERDVGVYVCFNTPELRECVGEITNNNPRREFVFADVVEVLASRGWKIIALTEDPQRAKGINTASDLLEVSATLSTNAPHSEPSQAQIITFLQRSYELACPDYDAGTLRSTFKSHLGPLFFYHWWEALWS
jgi:bifunctional UDP-N-acetylglucosamine pyrophosphorylase/glucosamine-1-phosphate N-acetyltransferase